LHLFALHKGAGDGEPGEIDVRPVPDCGMLTPVISMRVLTSDDWPLWRSLRLDALAEAPHAFGSGLADWQGDGDREARWRARLEIPGSHNVVALLGDEPVGMASGVPAKAASEVELKSMWVAPSARGRGVGEALLAEVERWAHARGATRFVLCIAEGNGAASGLYRRTGFAFTGASDLMLDGVRRELGMAKELHPTGATPTKAREIRSTPLP
jgi:ribosomal protein S18 acetylase RimI-like enzyme